MDVNEFADQFPCPFICSLHFQRSGASKVGSRLVLHETQFQELLLIKLEGTQVRSPTECNTVGGQGKQLINEIEGSWSVMDIPRRRLVQKQITELCQTWELFRTNE